MTREVWWPDKVIIRECRVNGKFANHVSTVILTMGTRDGKPLSYTRVCLRNSAIAEIDEELCWS